MPLRRTKIVCTIGPACSSRERLEALVAAGMDVARLNFSHGSHADHARVIGLLREIAERRGRPVAILQDLAGPKVRLGDIAAGTITMRRGQTIRLTTRPTPGDASEVNLPVPQLIAALRPHHSVFTDDGRLELRVVEVSGSDAVVRACGDGIVGSRKGVSAPGVPLDIPAVTERDLDDLRFGLAQGVDWVAASFIREPADLEPLRAAMDASGIRRPIVAKIEKTEAVRNIDALVRAADGIMVARGDLGVEVPLAEVPIVQKQVIALCNRHGKPVITATQMLDSMTREPRPTRAEVTDVANAILDGTDAVMLSGETAVGTYPVETVRAMARIARSAERLIPDHDAFADRTRGSDDVPDAVSRAAVEMAQTLRAAAIVCATASGGTARRVARHRPMTPVLGVTTDACTYRQMALVWGVQPVLIPPIDDTDGMIAEAVKAVGAHGQVRPGQRVVLTAGVPVNTPGHTNLIKVLEIGG